MIDLTRGPGTRDIGMNKLLERNTRGEVIRFAALGLKANGLYFLLYALMTMAGIDPRVAVVTIFAFGAIYSFWLNKFLVFKNAGAFRDQFIPYVIVYSLVCALNVGVLHFAVSR